MPIPLEAWQEKVERHYTSLANARKNSNMPIFALEHGLSNSDIEEISSLLRSQIKSGLSLERHWLLWVVYATEHGYHYNGEEYWWSFKKDTPGWDERYRYKVTNWFKKFHKTYNAVSPTGLWATHFKIIAWPITHSILPKFLQHQLAKSLYDLRYVLSRLETLDPLSIGKLITDNIYTPSTRFAQFLQQEELVGRLVLGLLGQELVRENEPIHAGTLERIITDLETLKNTRQWLKETRTAVKERFQGIAQGKYNNRAFANNEFYSTENNLKKIITSPTITLRYVGNRNWAAVLILPSLKILSSLNSTIKETLTNSYCILNFNQERKPPGWLLTDRHILLKRWPVSDAKVLQFEDDNKLLRYLLENDYILPPKEIWLFKIGNDYIARELKSKNVSPGGKYILVSQNKIDIDRFDVEQCYTNCDTVVSYKISIPEILSKDDLSWLTNNNLGVNKTITIWPAGLSCRSWDKQGNSEWLTTETPCFGLKADTPVRRYLISLDNSSPLVVRPPTEDSCVFIKLPPISIGTHFLEVEAELDTPEVTGSNIYGNLKLSCRDPENWNHHSASHSGFTVRIDPYKPRLDDLWRNEVSITILGAKGRYITCTVELYNSVQEKIFSYKISPPLELPLVKETWNKVFSKFLDKFPWEHLEATSGALIFDGEELGSYTTFFEKQLFPLQWVAKKEGNDIILRLIDNIDSEDNIVNILFSNDKPMQPVALDNQDLLQGIKVLKPGGLFLAQHGDYKDSIVISSIEAPLNFQELLVSSNFDHTMPLFQLINLLRLWSTAPSTGHLAEIQKKKIVAEFRLELYKQLYGAQWTNLESNFLNKKETDKLLLKLQSLFKNKTIPVVIKQKYSEAGNILSQRCDWYYQLAKRHKICSNENHCKLALMLAINPLSIFSENMASLLEKEIEQIKDNKPLLHGARLLALLLEIEKSEHK